MREEAAGIGCGFATLFLLVAFVSAWITHVVHTIQDEQWILLIIGALIAPVGVIHGIGIWLGVF